MWSSEVVDSLCPACSERRTMAPHRTTCVSTREGVTTNKPRAKAGRTVVKHRGKRRGGEEEERRRGEEGKSGKKGYRGA